MIWDVSGPLWLLCGQGTTGEGETRAGGGESQGFNLLKTEEEGTSLGHAFEGRRKVEEKRGVKNGWPEPKWLAMHLL